MFARELGECVYAMSGPARIRIGDWTATPALNLLERDGRSIKLEPRAMDLLIYLTSRPGEVVTADELMAHVWRGRVVEDSAVYKRINQVRKALSDDSQEPLFIETIPKRGYRLVAEVSTPPSHGPAAVPVVRAEVLPATSTGVPADCMSISDSTMPRTPNVELTPDGLKRSADTPPIDESISETTGSIKRNYLWIGLIVGAVVASGALRLLSTNDEEAQLVAERIRQLEVVIETGDWEEAYAQARQLDAIAPDSAELAALWSSFSLPNAILTDPPGARVFRSAYDAGDDQWEELGVTPLTHVRIPFGLSRLRFEIEGYRRVVQTTWQGGMLGGTTEEQRVTKLPVVVLDTNETLPDDKVRVPGWMQNIQGNVVDFGDYFLDRYEVTNRAFKKFVDAGGYERRELWHEPIIVDGREISWEDSLKLFVDRTGRSGPSTWVAGDYPDGQDDYPVQGVSWYEAMAYARFAGAELPSFYHWNHAVNPDATAWRVPRSNVASERVAAVGEYRGLGQYGTFDMSGNVREWVFNAAANQRYVLGGSWVDEPYRAGIAASALPTDRSEFNGFRLAQTFDSTRVAEQARSDIPRQPTLPDITQVSSISDELFEAYGNAFSYDRVPLNARIEDTVDSRNWIRERVTFDAAYSGSRMVLYLYLPKSRAPPYQTILYFPNVWFDLGVVIDENPFNVDFIVKDGRAVAYPMYAGGFERPDAIRVGIPWNSVTGRNRLIEIHQDLRRSIDYLETRTDIDYEAIGFYGLSMGGFLAPSTLALEPRIGAAVITVAGISNLPFLPEVDPMSYLPRVATPVLMLNGELDYIAPPESARLFYDLLGTAPEHKRIVTTPGGHFVPRDILARETLAWFDKYLSSHGN
jgi:DNA-binding winged helix-turn-helix (wHTH) protein/dienelactone hydrolase